MNVDVNTQNKVWKSIVEYAAENKSSISTLRRHIKSNKLVWKIEDGKYFILSDVNTAHEKNQKNVIDQIWDNEDVQNEESSLKSKLDLMQDMLRKANEEIVELKMLVKIYEEKIYGKFN